jgi:ectoine hydroxylase-related dioxygenase (phytanoyl-CoA dioxygenase family)
MMLEQRQTLATDGFVVLEQVVPPIVLDGLASVVRSLEERGRARSRQVLYTHRETPKGRPPLNSLMDQWLNPHRVAQPNTRAPAEVMREFVTQILGVEPVLFQDLLLRKRPGQRPFAWHQDYPFWPVDAPNGVVVWVPLQASDSARGGLAFARGSHQLGPRPVVDLHDGQPQDPGAALGFAPEQFEIVAPPYERGDAVAFLPSTFHGSPAMQRPGERVAWSSVWLAPTVRLAHANAPNHPLCAQTRDGSLVEEIFNVD